MKNVFLAILILLVIGGGLFWFSQQYEKNSLEEYALVEQGLVFSYKTGDSGYHLEDREIGDGEEYLVRDVVLTPTADYEDQLGREGGEGSPSWRLAVYENYLNQSPSVWVEANPMQSNSALIVDGPYETIVAGANAVSYTIDGLYPTDVVVIAHGGLMFVASSSYLDDSSQTKQDFPGWLESFTFVPPQTAGQGKIDVRVACESALAYTTFMNGEDADRFLEECINGEHPDVVERYIESLGVDGALI